MAAGVGLGPTYYSPGIAPPRLPSARQRPRRGSLERPINGRLYRGTWLIVAIPLLITAFSVARPQPLERPRLAPTFKGVDANVLIGELTQNEPDRSPGSPGAERTAEWVADQLRSLGFEPHTDRFQRTIPGRGPVQLTNVSAVAVAPTSSRAIVVMAHRDDTGAGEGANDNASGTAALLELARGYGRPVGSPGRAVTPSHTIVFLSTDGGAFGALGARRFATSSPYRRQIAALVNLDALGGHGPARLELGGDRARSPAGVLVETAAARIEEQTGTPPQRTSALGQLVDLAFPFSFYEQAPFLGRGFAAVTLTTGDDRPPASFGDRARRIDIARLGELGRAAQSLLSSLDAGPLPQGTSSYVYLGGRLVRGWAIELSLFAMLLPFLAVVVDLFARSRRRRIRLAPALRSYRTRLAFWLWAGALFELFAVLGVWPKGVSAPVNPESSAAGSWPALGIVGLLALLAVSWLVARDRLRPRRAITSEEDLAGHVAALLALGVISLAVVALNPFSLVFLLPALHTWIWLPQLRARAGLQAALLAAGFLGPALLVGSFAFRYGLGLDAPWYLAELSAIGYVPIVVVMVVLASTACAMQLAMLTLGRYAPYPRMSERPPRGPIRNAVRAVVLGVRAQRRHATGPSEVEQA